MTAVDADRRVSELIARLRAERCSDPGPEASGATLPRTDRVTAELVRALLVWESTERLADEALRRLNDGVVDVNDLRVCMVDEIAAMLGRGYPLAHERATRLRGVLNAVFAREHSLSLSHLQDARPEVACEYLRSLPDTPAFVTARLMVRLGHGHMAPVDQRMLDRLIEAQAFEAGTTQVNAASVLERVVPIGEMAAAYAVLQAWSDERPVSASDEPSIGEKRSHRSVSRRVGRPRSEEQV